MGVINSIIQKSSLNGMPMYYKAPALIIFGLIITLLITMLVLLLIYGPNMNIRFGY